MSVTAMRRLYRAGSRPTSDFRSAEPCQCISERQALEEQDGRRVEKARLEQDRAAESFQVVLAVGVQFPWQLVGDPGQRTDVLRAATRYQHRPLSLSPVG